MFQFLTLPHTSITPGLLHLGQLISINPLIFYNQHSNYVYCSWKSDVNGAIILKWILEKQGQNV
jgi:hypothetical protein